MAVYAENSSVSLLIVGFLQDLLSIYDVPNSILEVLLHQYDAYVAAVPLGLNVSFTDYYPKELQDYFHVVYRRVIMYTEESAHIAEVAACAAESRLT